MNNTLILNTGQCSWQRCLFCGYGKKEGKKANFENLKKLFDNFFKNFSGKEIKIFGSGSFLDESQVPKKAREYFIKKCKENKVEKVTIESRPEFITKEKIKEFSPLKLTIAIGLEVADDKILKKLKKGFSLRDFEKVEKIIHNSGAKLRTYLLVNLPFLKNWEKSLEKSVSYAKKISDSVVLINLLPHKDSEVFKLWIKGEWHFLSREEFFQLRKKFKSKKVELDVETFHFVPRFPKELRKPLKGLGEEFLTHPYYEVWQDYLQRWYQPPKEKNILLFLPCSYKKPYSESKTHRKILEKLKKIKNYRKIHQVMISSPGVIPREFENYYPFNAYDWDEKEETEEIKERYIEVTAERIKKYLKAHQKNYEKIFSYLKYDSESYQALKKACKNLNLNFENLLKRRTYEKIKKKKNLLIREEALKDLRERLEEREEC